MDAGKLSDDEILQDLQMLPEGGKRSVESWIHLK